MKKSCLAVLLAAAMLLTMLPTPAFAAEENELARLSDEPAAVESPAVEAPEDAPEVEVAILDPKEDSPAQSVPAEMTEELDESRTTVELPQDEDSQLMMAGLDPEEDSGTEEGSGIPAMKMDMYLDETFAGSLYFTSSGTEATLAYAENLTGAIKVPETFQHEGTTYRVTKIGRAALCNQTGLTQIWLPNNLIEIESKAFSGCDHLKAVGSYEEGGACDPYALPDGLTDIWPSTFYGCTRLSSVKIGAQVTDIWHYAFAYCYSLGQNYTDANGVTYGVYFDEGSRLTYINQGAFQQCIVLDNITLPEGLTYIGPNAFYQCTAIMERNGKEEYVGLKNVVIPDGVKTIGEKAFQYCFTMDTLSIPAAVETIEDKAFYSCSHLRHLEFRGTGTKKIEMGTMVFYWCRSLETIQLPANLEILPAWTFAYAGYNGQFDVVLPEGMTKIGQYAFNESGIRSITFSSTITEVDMLAFGDCHALTTINWPEKAPGEDPVSLGMMAFTDCENLTSLTLPKLHITTGDNLFYDCDNLKKVTVSDGATFIPDSAFRDCDNLTAVVLPASLMSIHEQAFYTCPSLTDVDLTAATGLQTIGALAFCRTALSAVTIPASVQSIGKEAFGINRALRSFTVEAGNKGGYYVEDGILYQRKTVDGKAQVHLVRYPAALTDETYDIPAGVTHIDEGACSHSEYLVTVNFPESLTTIGNSAFSHCVKLKNAQVGARVTQGDWVFDGCYQLITVSIPDGTTILGNGGFEPTSLSKVTTLTIPESVTTIYPSSMKHTGSPFQDLPLLESIAVEPGNENFVSVDGVVFTKDMKTLIAYPPAKQGEEYTVPDGVTTIAMNAFMNVSNLKKVTIPASVENIGTSAFVYASILRMDIYRELSQITAGGLYNEHYARFLYGNSKDLQIYVHGDPTSPADDFLNTFVDKCAQGSGLNTSSVHIDFIRPVIEAGDKFCVDGVIYTLSDPEAKTVTVGDNHNYARSQVTIPTQVSHDETAYTVTAVEPNAFTGAANLTTASVMLTAAQIGAGAFDSKVTVTSRDTMTDFILNTCSLAYGDTLVVSTPASLAEGTAVTLTGSNGSVSAAVTGGTAVFPVDKALYDAVASAGKDVTVTLTGGTVTTEGVHIIVSPKTYGPDDVNPDGPGTDKCYIAKPYDGTNIIDLISAEPLEGFLVEGDDVAVHFYNGTSHEIEASPNMNYPFEGELELVGEDAGYYAIDTAILARPQSYFYAHVDFGQLYIKEVDGVLQKPVYRRVWSSEDGMRVRDCGLGGGQFVAYLPTETKNGEVTAYETIDVEGYFVYTDPNPYPAYQDSGDFPVSAGGVYSWDFIPSGNDRQELLKNYRFSGSFMPWDPALSKDDSDGPTNNLVGEAGENPPLPGYVKPERQEEPVQPEKPDQLDTDPAQSTPTTGGTDKPTDEPVDDPTDETGDNTGGSTSDEPSSGGENDPQDKDTTVEVSDSMVAQAVSAVQKGEPVVLEVNAPSEANAVAVSLSAKNLKAIADGSDAGMTIQTPMAKITLDDKALELVRGDGTQDAVISIQRLTQLELPKKIAAAAESTLAYQLSVTAGGKTISDFGEGSALVSIPLDNSQVSAEDLLACRMENDGTLTPVAKSAMVDGEMCFQVSQPSTYVLMENTDQFRDTQTHWAKTDVSFSAGRNIVVGVGGGRFEPDEPATVAAAVTVLGRLAGVEDAENAADWAKPHLAWAAQTGVLPEGIVPDAPISREQMAYLLTHYMGEGTGADVSYTDLSSANPDYLSSIQRVRALGLMHGRTNNTFDPKGSLTRAELATVLHRVVLAQLQGVKAR